MLLKKILFIHFFLSITCICFSQVDSNFYNTINNIEADNNHLKGIDQLNNLLATKQQITDSQQILIKTALVHKFQELKWWDTCVAYCQEQIAIAHKNKKTFIEASFYKSLGNTYYHLANTTKAIEYWEKCLGISEANNFDILKEQCTHNIGSILLEKGLNMKDAEKYLLKSIQYSKQNNTITTTLGTLHYRLLATLYSSTNRFKEATAMFKQVIDNTRISKDSANLAEALMFYSRSLNLENKYNEALIASAEAVAISRLVNRLDMVQTALDFHSRNLAATGDYKEAFNVQQEVTQLTVERYKGDLSGKISEAEAKFKTSEIQYEKEIAAIKSKKEKQLYILGFLCLFGIAAFVFNYLYQKRNLRQKLLMQMQVQEEKERLSRDLHDNLGSQMALLSNSVEGLNTNYKKQFPIDDSIEQLQGTSKQLLQTLRETIWILNKEQISTQEFFDKLVDYAHRYLQSYPLLKLQVTETFITNKSLNSNEALQLFRICQEAITNACKYSESDYLAIEGVEEEQVFSLTIKDKGKGFDIQHVQSGDHYGLKNIQKRAKTINAKVTINTSPGNGVEIIIKL